MVKLDTSYMGLNLKNPIIAASSGLTDSLDKLQKLEKNGVGAVVLKSLFEEQINLQTGSLLKNSDYPEAEDYIRAYAEDHEVSEHIKLIEAAHKELEIPIIASINAVTARSWTEYAQRLQEAGADAIELNINIIPTSQDVPSQKIEERYSEIVKTVKKQVKLPVAVKIGPHFTNMFRMAQYLFASGASAITLFNKFYEPDINIEQKKITTAEVFTSPADLRHSLRWIGMLSPSVNGEFSATTGVHSGEAVIKLLLAGATTVQMASVLYKNGPQIIPEFLEQIESWMKRKRHETIKSFRGELNYGSISDPMLYERSQFMKYYSSHT